MGIASRDIVGPQTSVVSTTNMFTPIGDHVRVDDLTSATVIMPGDIGIDTTTKAADKVLIQADTQNVRITLSPGSTPTATIGFLLRTTDDWLPITLRKGVTLKAIEVVGGAALQVQFGA